MASVRTSRRLVLAAFAALTLTSAVLVGFTRADAQVDPGEFEGIQPHQSGKCFWVRRNAAGTREWWAYIEGEYEFADSSNTSGNPWTISATYAGNSSYDTYQDWKDMILALPETDGKTVIFEDHAISTSVVEN